MQLSRNLLLLLAMVGLIVISMTGNSQAQVFSGFVTSTSGSVLSGVQAEVVGHPEVTPVLSDANGMFVLTGIPAGASAEIKLSKNGYLPLYTAITEFFNDIYVNFSNQYPLATQTEFTAWGVTASKGIIMSTTYDNNGNAVAATVTATGSSHGSYPVNYGSDCGLSTPDSSGVYCVNNVDDADTITVSASYTGYTFTPRTLIGHANSKGHGVVRANITYSFYVKNYSGAIVSGVLAAVVGHPEITSAYSDAYGFVTLAGIPASTGKAVEIILTKAGYLPLYTAKSTYITNISNPATIAYALANQGNFTTWRITSGNGILQARTRDQDDTNIAATVTATGNVHGPYTVTYGLNCNSNTPVYSDPNTGKYCVNNVVADDTITVSASLAGYTFSSRTFVGHANSLGQTSIKGTSTPVITSFTPTSGQVGDVVIITGTNLTGSTVATVNGVSVAITEIDSAHVSVTVPANTTTTGVITVSTPNGRGASTATFTVLPNTLTVNLSGTGSGNVTATSGATLSCASPSTTCTSNVLYGTLVNLSATPSLGSTFTSWIGACTSTPCTFFMYGDQTATATFTLQQNMKIGSTYYGTLQSALDAVQNGETILLQKITLPDGGTVTYSRSGVTATLKGGYDSGFSTQTGYTTLHGILVVSKGRLNVNRLIIRS